MTVRVRSNASPSETIRLCKAKTSLSPPSPLESCPDAASTTPPTASCDTADPAGADRKHAVSRSSPSSRVVEARETDSAATTTTTKRPRSRPATPQRSAPPPSRPPSPSREDARHRTTCRSRASSSKSPNGRSKKLARRDSPPVRFAEPLVTAVRTRPRTPPAEREILFYSADDEHRFRADYREERAASRRARREGEEEEKEDIPTAECVPVVPATLFSESSAPLPPAKSSKDYRIAMAVVVHEGSVQTYVVDPVEAPAEGSGRLPEAKRVPDHERFDFDNPDFWNGTITWY